MEMRALFHLVFHLDPTGVLQDDVAAQGQAEPRALAGILGGEEGLEDPPEVFRRDARAGIGDGR